jgi:hypothetical protein
MDRIERHKLKKLIILNSIILIVCSITFFLRIIMNVVSARKKQAHDKWSYFVFETIVTFMGIINAVFGLIMAICERRKHRAYQLNYKLINLIHLILNIICAILFSLFFVIEFIRWCSNLLNDSQVRNGVRLVVILFALVIGLCQTACAIENRILAWSPKYRYSRFVLCFSSTILMAISIASIVFNVRVRHLEQNAQSNGSVPLWCFKTFQASSSLTLVSGLVGVGLTFVYGRENSGPNQFRRRLRHFFNIFCAIGFVLVVIFTVILLCYHKKFADKTNSLNIHTLILSNLLLSIVQCILLLFIIKSLQILVRATQPGRNGLTVERIQLSQISPAYVKHWAAAIDAFNCIPEGMTGDAALQLMKAYENGQLENIECIVLRIARSGRYIPIPSNQRDNTEALVLLTIVHNYDAMVAAHINGFWSTFLKRTLGSKICTKCFHPLSLRLGLIGYQWPFRTSIFFTTSHPDPLTRATHVLETIIDWNEMQKSNIHCDVLLLPTLSTELIAKAISIAGFFPLRLPPTHLLDLRPHRGKTWNEYMKTLKKGNRRPYIQQFLTKGGTIEEVHDISPREVGETVCQQWENIARIRREKKEPSPLAKPSPEFISSMGNAMNEPYRSVVFLRFNNEVIASSVIYKFPYKLITTDIQGLTHEKARPLKAYFVMLQWVIKEALDKRYDFVDFGPTTPGPKLDLGCKSVPLEVGGYAGNPILAFGIQQAGSSVDSIHHQNDNQQQGSSAQNGKEQDESQPATQLPTGKNVEKTTYLNSSQTHIPEALSVTVDNETRSATAPTKKVNPPKKKGSNGSKQPRQNPSPKKQSINETKENESVHELQLIEPVKSADIVPESNDSTVKEARSCEDPQTSQFATDILIPQISLSDPLISGNINIEIKHTNTERLDFI